MSRKYNQHTGNGRGNRMPMWVLTLFLLLLLAVFKGLFGQTDVPATVTEVEPKVETENEIFYEFRRDEYLEASNELVILSTDGYIRTYFRPEDGIEYFNRQ